MKAVLASADIINSKIFTALENLAGNSKLDKCTFGILPNAGQGTEKAEMVYWTTSSMQSFCSCNFMLLDLEYLDKHKFITSLNNCDGLVITGGLVSRLMRILDSQNLRQHVESVIRSNKLLLTTSAGSMCMSKTQELAINYIGEPDPDAKDVEGFGLIDFEVYPHFTQERLEDVKNIINGKSINAYLLKNGEALVVNGSEVNFVGNPILI